MKTNNDTNNESDPNIFTWSYNNSIIKIMDTEKEELKKSLLNKTGIKLKNLLLTDMNNTRIKDSNDIDDFIKITQRSLYRSDEETMINIYNHSDYNDNNEISIHDLNQNYSLIEKYLHNFKCVMNNEVNKLIKNVLIKQEKLKEIEEKKIQNKIVKIQQNYKETKIETEYLIKISILPTDIIRLIESYILTPEIRLILIKQKYDNKLFNIINKMNVKALNTFIRDPGNVRRRMYTYLRMQEPRQYFYELINEYNTRDNYIRISIKKPFKIKSIIDNMNNYYKLLILLQNTNKYNNVCREITTYLIKCYNTCIYVSNRKTEQNIIKINERKLNRQSTIQQQQQQLENQPE